MVAESIKLITKNKNNRLELNEEALEKLRKINDTFGVCVCVGPYRQGKSYLLSRLIGNGQNGFKIGHTDQACTKGITMWSEPVRFQTPTGVKNLLLFDTEGLESDESNPEWDNKLFLVSLILSSMFVYNTKNSLTHDAFKKLATITSFYDKVSTTAVKSTSATTRSEFRNLYGPTFTWVVRDFALVTSVTPKQKLDNFLRTEQFSEDTSLSLKENEKIKLEIKARNQIRECMLDTFKELFCYYLPVPVVEGVDGMTYEQALARMDSLPASKLRPSFELKLNEFVMNMRENFQLKKIKDQKMNGPVFVEFIKQVVENINQNSKIYLLDNLNLSMKLVANDLLETAKNKYETKMENLRLPLSESKFDESESLIYQRCLPILESSLDSNLVNEIKLKFNDFVYGENGANSYYFSLNQKLIEKQNMQIVEKNWNDQMKSKLDRASEHYRKSSELLHEIGVFKSDVKTELFECDDFEKIWKEFSSQLELNKVIKQLDELERERKELEETRRIREAQKEEIEDLRDKLEKLIIENRRLTFENQNFSSEIRKLTFEQQNLTSENRKLTLENQNLVSENQRLNNLNHQTQNSCKNQISSYPNHLLNDSVNSFSSISSASSPDITYGSPYRTKMDGTPDMRYRENRAHLISPEGVRLKNDGTPDMRFKENRKNLISYR